MASSCVSPTLCSCKGLAAGLVLLCLSFTPAVESAGFMHSTSLTASELESELQHAVGAALGCGGEVSAERRSTIEGQLMPMWATLPKNRYGRIERKSLRYLAHRYFMQQSSLLVRGFETTRVVNSSESGTADILSKRVPMYVETALEGKHAIKGFTLEDAVTLVAVLEQLIFDSESHLLEASYTHMRRVMQGTLDRRGLTKVLEAYLVYWMMGDDTEGINILLSNRSLLEGSFPHWRSLVSFAAGEVQSLEFRRQLNPRAGRGRDTLGQRYTFNDAHEVVAGITRSFGSFWESECISMKESLVSMDPDKDGRVPLSKFYGTGLDSEWRFGESEAYLRELGALDESSLWRGKQVIIPNYLQAASNCIVSTPHYLVCCAAECESILGDIEIAVGAPVASPEQILQVVGNMSSVSTSLEEDEQLDVQGVLAAQLRQVAAPHGGKVPLHGRLFAQWLHYAFPRECPFPHKAGHTKSATPTEFGGDYVATPEEMRKHASASQPEPQVSAVPATDELPGQWSADEELFADYGSEHLGSVGWGGPGVGSLFLLGGVALAVGLWKSGMALGSGNGENVEAKFLKSHLV